MKKKLFGIIGMTLCVALLAPFAQACAKKKLAYEGGALERAEIGKAYEVSVATAAGAGGDGEITYALKKGDSLPDGLELSVEGEIGGVPTAKGEYSFTINAKAGGYTGEAEFTLEVIARISYSGAILAGGIRGTDYAASVASATGADGIRYGLKTGAALPPGLELNQAGQIGGKPGASGSYSFTVIAGADGYESAEAVFVISVSLPELVYGGGPLADAHVGMPYKTGGGQTVTVATAAASGSAGIVYATMNESGADPLAAAGLALNADGTITGTPNASAAGEIRFTAIASAGEGYTAATAVFTIAVSKLPLLYNPSAPTDGTELTPGKAGTAYTGGNVGAATAPEGAETAAAIRYTKTSGPSWLSIGNVSGAVSGTPAEKGLFTVTVQAQDREGNYLSADAVFTIAVDSAIRYKGGNLTARTNTVYNGDALTVATASVLGASPEPEITYAVTGANPLTAAGLALNADGTVTGNTSAAALPETAFTVTAAAAGCESVAETWTITVSALSLIAYPSSALPNGTVNAPYTASVASASVSETPRPEFAYRVASGGLPGGLSLNEGGTISGTPAVAGTFSFSVRAQATGYTDGIAQFTIGIDNLGSVAYSASALPNGKITAEYLTAGGGAVSVGTAEAPGDPVIRYAVTDGILPPGLTLSASGAIAGIPQTLGTFDFFVTASAENYTPAAVEFTIAVTNLGGVSYTGRALPDGFKNQAYSVSVATAAAQGNPSINYALQSGYSLPNGLALENGAITGVPAVSGDFSFRIVAAAENYTSAGATFTLRVNEQNAPVTGAEYIVAHTEGATATYVFEAENTNLTGKRGVGYSGNLSGKDIAVGGGDITAAGASRDMAVNYLYRKGISVDFLIISDRDVEDATLTLRLSAEYMDMIIDPESYLIRVDQVPDAELNTPYETPPGSWGAWDTEFIPYYEAAYYVDNWDCGYIDDSEAEVTGIRINALATGAAILPFQNFVITTRLKLFRGATCVSLITNSDQAPVKNGLVLGTMEAVAPIVDCIGITTTAQIGMYKPQDNDCDNTFGCWIDAAGSVF
ncbi:MAG: Ig domain-containing protein [Clostridiales bacterium]|jgi:hypothetical protein|nr:Ig domain-containing protein [Clostridiales bacterium]